jgi:fatty acid desaturase
VIFVSARVALVALALTVGGSLSLCQFAVLHDVLHGGVVKGRTKEVALPF